ncbi:MAG: glucosyltransferase domain-containing protein, partial [Malacoplasma sp.]
MKDFKEDFKNYIEKSKKFILIVIIFLLLSFGIRLLSNSLSIDTELFMFTSDALHNTWQGMGRWGLVFFNKLIMGNFFLLPFSNLLTFFNILIYSILINFLLYSLLNDKNKQFFTKYQFILTAIFITSPIFAEQYGFTLQNVSVSFSIVLTSLSLIAFNYYLKSSDKKRNVCILIICVIATILSFAVYQAIVPFYIAMVIICYYLKITNVKSKNNEWKYLFSNICFFLISIVFYYIIAEILSTNVTYLKFGWVENGLSLTFKYLHDVINKMLSCETIFYNVSYL